MKVPNLNSLRPRNVACRMVLCCVGLLTGVFSGGTLILPVHAQNGPASDQSTNPGQVATRASEAKTKAANNTGKQSQLTNSPGATIEQVHLSGKDRQTQVRVEGTGHLTYEAFRLDQPDRLVLDFSSAIVRLQERSLSSSFYPVRLVRVGQFKADVARVVIEIEKQLPYTIAASKNAVTVVFNPGAVPEPRVTTKKVIFTSAAAVPREPVPSAAPQTLENGQEVKSLSESSMQSAMARPADLGDEPSTAAATGRQTAQVQIQPVTSGSVTRPGEKNSPQPLSVDKSLGQQPAITAMQTVSGYVLGPDDEIMIRGIESAEISGTPDKPVLIGTNGNITLPLIGRVKAGGLTVEQLEAELNTRFKEFIKDPQISVTVTEFRSQPVSVFGAVTKPGIVQLRGRQTLYEVLSMAGGPRDTAGSILTVTRPRQSGEIPLAGVMVDPTGQFSSVELNVQEILEGKNPAANIEIRPNDIISVSEASSNMIYVVGDVQHAGAFTLGGQRNVSVLRAVSLAGGLGHTAKPEKARVVREVPGEPKPMEITVNIQQILSGKAKDIELGPNDVLVVPTSGRKTFTTTFIPATVSAAVSAAIYHY
jgi:polysaccharide export outer membrane protein